MKRNSNIIPLKCKPYYCNLPKFMPKRLQEYVERHLWVECKIHDNEIGKWGMAKGISLTKAHYNFTKGILFYSTFPWLVRPFVAIIALPIIIWRRHGDANRKV